jgi:hypothetical protein
MTLPDAVVDLQIGEKRFIRPRLAGKMSIGFLLKFKQFPFERGSQKVEGSRTVSAVANLVWK